jgi:hypothetical protein
VVAKSLRFSDLSTRHIGVSDGVSDSYSEAARVCLDRHHKSPVEFRLRDNSKDAVANALWVRADGRTINAWANRDDATEAGAYALALAAIEVMRGLVAVRRAETRTGADYYLGDPSITFEDLEASFGWRYLEQTKEVNLLSEADYGRNLIKPKGGILTSRR